MDVVFSTKDLVVGAAGSILGAIIISIFGFGWKTSQATRRANQSRWQLEEEEWKKSASLARIEISYRNIFLILKNFVLGSVLTNMSFLIESFGVPGIFLIAPGTCFFILSLIRIVKFAKLMQIHTFGKFIEGLEAQRGIEKKNTSIVGS